MAVRFGSVAAVSLLLALAACGSKAPPGAMTAGEGQALNDAAMMLDANSMDANAATIDDDNQEQSQ